MSKIYINIADFVHNHTGRRPGFKRFKSYNALRNYILKNPKKRFPLKMAKGSPILRWMLITVNTTIPSAAASGREVVRQG